MNSHTVQSYDSELTSLIKDIISMGELVKEILLLAEKSICKIGENFIDEAEKIDEQINFYDNKIELHSTEILALRQPMAIDLRQALSALRIAVIMERMGDLCKNSVRRASKVEIQIQEELTTKILLITNLISNMISDLLKAFKNFDIELAESVIIQDEKIDEIYHKLMDIIQQKIVLYPSDISSYIHIIFSIKNFERIGDYTMKIARMLIYIVTAETPPKIRKPR